MGSGWLSPWSIYDPTTGKWIIKKDDGLPPSWEFPNKSGVVALLSDVVGAAASIPAAQALTIAAGVITPTLPTGLYANVILTGEGSADDDLTKITAPIAWVGKRIIIRAAGAGVITIKAGQAVITKVDFSEDSIYDTYEAECIGVDTWIAISRSDNG
jgi:hypothetical protein